MLLDTRLADPGPSSAPVVSTRSVRARAGAEMPPTLPDPGLSSSGDAAGAGSESLPLRSLQGAPDDAGGATGASADLTRQLANMVSSVRALATEGPLWSLSDEEVGDAFAYAQALREAAQALSVMVAREADERGLAGAVTLGGADWLRSVAGARAGADADTVDGGGSPTVAVALEGGEAATLSLLGSALREPRWAALAALVAACEVSAAQAGVIVRFQRDLAAVADRDHLDDVVASLVEAAPVLTVRELRRLVGHARASLRPPAEAEAGERGLRAGRSLRRVGSCAGFVDFLLRLDPEGAAVLEAAIDPLSRPRPDLDWSGWPEVQSGTTVGADAPKGGVDPRTPATRRADALLELVGRAVGAPEGVARTPRTALVVTMSVEALLGQVRGAGVADDDAVLTPGAVRRLACEAGIIPMVLGGPSEVLDVGRAQRFFTPAQRRALARRDGGCSYPGCTIPPQWCEAHHVVHWLYGGRTDLCNGALLCGRHHTVVHERGLTATVTAFGVTWHR